MSLEISDICNLNEINAVRAVNSGGFRGGAGGRPPLARHCKVVHFGPLWVLYSK